MKVKKVRDVSSFMAFVFVLLGCLMLLDTMSRPEPGPIIGSTIVIFFGVICLFFALG